MRTLGQEIRSLRKGLNLTQADIAGDDMTNAHISILERDKALPTIQKLRVIASRLQKPVYYLQSFIVDSRDSYLQQLIVNYERLLNKLANENVMDALMEVEDEILTLLPLGHDAGLRANFYAAQGYRFIMAGKFHDAVYSLRTAIEIYRELGFLHKVIRTQYNLSNTYIRLEEYAQALKFIQQALLIDCEENIATEKLSLLLKLSQAFCTLMVGQLDRAFSFYSSLQEMPLSPDDAIHVLLALSSIKSKKAVYEESLAFANKAYMLAKEHHNPRQEAKSLLSQIYIKVSLKEKSEANALINLLMETKVDADILFRAMLVRIQLQLEAGDYSGSRSLVNDLQRKVEGRDSFDKAKLLMMDGRWYEQQGDYSNALKRYTEAKQLFKDLETGYEMLQCAHLIASVLGKLNRSEDAYRILQHAGDLYFNGREV